ncbi:Glycerophosphoryl diester phosphodiesterase [Planctomycetes bacterium Pan216]|uniref:Glycerophosphoryl diester phosphodiesterase n=1 Tax=Kolteria novifilia TaxID=2527975 RepID=A0A518B3P7_9BACT|nr:Glycerophosphoryl diester phosphodiesterase [Planctomycetes bacterium Pan216]
MNASFLILFVFLFFGAFAIADDSLPRPQTPARRLLHSKRPLLIAHRGNSSRAPENTLPAFRSALEVGVDMVELDYHHSADGVPFCFHDKDLKRTTNAKDILGQGDLEIAETSTRNLLRLDGGRWYSSDFAGTAVPTLAESLDTIQPGAMTLIERKAGDAATLVDLLRQKKLTGDVIVQAFDWDYLADVRRLSPETVVVCLGKEAIDERTFALVAATGAEGIGWRARDLTASAIDAAHAKGLRVFAWTVDDPAEATRLLDAGLDGLITNRPAELRELVAKDRE